MSYALYTIWPATVAKFHTESLLYTVPFVAYGIFRYLYLVRVSETSEDPSQVLLTDRPIGIVLVLYLAMVVFVLYVARDDAGGRGRRGVEVEARAKLNLGLAVGPPRPDGFHDLATVFQSISLADTLVARSPRRRLLADACATRTPRCAAHRARRARGRRAGGGRQPGAARGAAAGGARSRASAGRGSRWSSASRRAGRHGRRQRRRGGGPGGADALYGVRRPRAQRLALAAELGSDVPFARSAAPRWGSAAASGSNGCGSRARSGPSWSCRHGASRPRGHSPHSTCANRP